MARPISGTLSEAVDILSSWSAKVGGFIVVPQSTQDGARLIAKDRDGNVVGALTWRPSDRVWHVVVGAGSWSVTPRGQWSPKELSEEVSRAAKFANYWLVPEAAPVADSAPEMPLFAGVGA